MDDAVVGDAAAALDTTRHFRIAIPDLRYSTLASLDSAQARSMGRAYLGQFWIALPEGLQASWSLGHGAPLQLNDLAQCGRVRLAASAVAARADELNYIARRAFGEYWVFRYCTEGDATAGFVAVSPYATDIVVAGDSIVFPLNSGAEFQSGGLPPLFEEVTLYSPETAAIMAYQCSGKRVSRTPRLVQEHGATVSRAKWEVVLESPVSLTTSAGMVSVDTLYAGWTRVGGAGGLLHEGLATASADQPPTIEFRIVSNMPGPTEPIPPGWVPEFSTVQVARDPTIPTLFDSVLCRQGFPRH